MCLQEINLPFTIIQLQKRLLLMLSAQTQYFVALVMSADRYLFTVLTIKN